MSDIADDAQRLEEAERESAIARVMRRAAVPETSAEECVRCGGDIPVARRLAVPGVLRCTPCQALFEKTGA